jgi:DnaJ-class molecular chaperone
MLTTRCQLRIIHGIQGLLPDSGGAREATAEEIKKAFRKLARKYHPDVSKEPDAEARMKELNEANAVLSDPEKRAAYDQLGRGYQPGQDFRPPPDWDAGFEFSGRGFAPGEAADFSDFFAELFGRMGGARGFAPASERTFPGPRRGPPRQGAAGPRRCASRRHPPDFLAGAAD